MRLCTIENNCSQPFTIDSNRTFCFHSYFRTKVLSFQYGGLIDGYVASKQYAYFRRSKYVKRSIELSWYNLTNTIQHKIINKYGIKKGDLLYFDGNGDGIYTHTSIISSIIKVKGKKIICYAAHTVNNFNKKLLNNKDKKNPKK